MDEVLQLFDGNAVDDDLLLLAPAERAKKCTGAQAEKLAMKENAILAMIASQWPVKRIASLLEVSDHTVTVMVCRHAEKVATFSKEFADRLLGKAAELLARGLMKADDLSAFQCFVAHGIVADKAVAIVQNASMMGGMGEKESSKDVEDHAAAAAKLRAWFEAGASGAAPKLLENGDERTNAQHVGNQ
jgi:hypothetical protein